MRGPNHWPVVKKSLFRRRGCRIVTLALIFQNIISAGVGTEHRIRIAHDRSGCRGFIGPVPPPLWMSRLLILLFCGCLPNLARYYHTFWQMSRLFLKVFRKNQGDIAGNSTRPTSAAFWDGLYQMMTGTSGWPAKSGGRVRSYTSVTKAPACQYWVG
jgi:hypothetical protein